MAEEKLTREDCLLLLKEKFTLLRTQEDERYPCRSDFSEREVVAIKAFLGPWPRALEAAGIKPPCDPDRAQRNLEKRILAKRKRNAARKEAERLKKKNQNAEPLG